MTLAHDTFFPAWFEHEYFRWMPINVCALVAASYLSSSIIEVNRQYKELALVQEHFYKNTGAAIRFLDKDGFIRVVNKESEAFYHLPLRDIFGKAEKDLLGNGNSKNELGFYYSPLEETLETEVEFSKIEKDQLLENGDEKFYEMNTYLLKDERQETLGVLGVFNDVTEMRRLKNNLERITFQMDQMAMTDAVTNLYNFQYFRDALAKKNAEKDQEWTLLMIHVDNLEDFFLTFGRQSGEKILKEIGLLLRQHIGDECIVARYGDTAFSVLYPQGNHEPAQRMADLLRREAETNSFGDFQEVSPGDFTLSIGILPCPKDVLTSGEDWMTLAEKVLFQAKAAGPNNTELVE